jgi:hypothetical protein
MEAWRFGNMKALRLGGMDELPQRESTWILF